MISVEAKFPKNKLVIMLCFLCNKKIIGQNSKKTTLRSFDMKNFTIIAKQCPTIISLP
jgi:hypothetical protein